MVGVGSYLKKYIEVLVKDVGIEFVCELIGKFKVILGWYYFDYEEYVDCFMFVDVVVVLEEVFFYLYVIFVLVEFKGILLLFDECCCNEDKFGGVSMDVIVLSQWFVMLMVEYY